MLFRVAERGSQDARRAGDPGVLGAVPPDNEFAEEPRTVIDGSADREAESLSGGQLDSLGNTPSTLGNTPSTLGNTPGAQGRLGDTQDSSDDRVPVREPTHELTHPPGPPGFGADPPAIPDPVHHLPTQQLGAPPRSASISKPSASATANSPVDAMKLDEIARTRIFLKVAVAVIIGGIIVALSTGGDPVAKVVVLVGSGAAALGAFFVLILTRDPETYDARRLVVPALPIVFGSMSGVYYWGTGSPVAAMLVYGIYFFSLGANRKVTRGLYVLVAVIHGVLGLGIITGQLDDHGVIRIDQLRTREQVAILCIIEALYFVAYYTARVSQRVTLEAMGKLEQAVRGNAQRDALLAEARAELDRALKIGGPGRFTEQVIGSFRLGVLIGRGGMGEVYEAHGVTDQREAAVKLLNPGTLAEPVQLQRFLREAHIAARLDCPHIVRVLEVGTTAGELPFLAMERLRGSDLAHQLRRQRRLPLPQAKVLVDQLAIGLEAARVAGIVHRDLKPHNVFFAEEVGLRRWKILDFGVSKSGGSGTLTQGHVVGTPAYMAPEQARGEDVDHRADVYSLASIIFRAITGHPVFSGKDVPSTLYEVVFRVPSRPSLLAPLSADVDRVLAIGLAKDPRDRFHFALELARWFSAAVGAGLDPDQRRRADELIARYPWGTRPSATTGA
jgi:eukaryotic-like serine/threonine-protein kinase